MFDIDKMSLHDSIIENIDVNPEKRTVVISLNHMIDQEVEERESLHEAKYCQAYLSLLDYQQIEFVIKGDKNKEIILTTNVIMGNNPQEGLIHVELYTTSDSWISIYCNGYSFEELGP